MNMEFVFNSLESVRFHACRSNTGDKFGRCASPHHIQRLMQNLCTYTVGVFIDNLKGDAAQVGLHLGDVLVAVDGRPVSSLEDLEAMIQQGNGSESFKVDVIRPALSTAYNLDDLISDARKLPWLLNWIQTSFEAHEANLMQVVQ